MDTIYENILSNGSIIASPSKKPDYNFHWIRDGAIVIKSLIDTYYKNDEHWGLSNFDIKTNKYTDSDVKGYKSPIEYAFSDRICFIPSITVAILYHIVDNLVDGMKLSFRTISSKIKIKLGYIKRVAYDKLRN